MLSPWSCVSVSCLVNFMGIKRLTSTRYFDWGMGFVISIATSIAFCFLLIENNNIVIPYGMFYGPVSIVLNYQIQWNSVFPQALWETNSYLDLFKILGLISVLWILYWGVVLRFIISFVRRKKYASLLILVLGVVLINYFSVMFQKWFIGMRTVM